MRDWSITAIADQLNLKAVECNYSIGRLQQIRKELKPRSRGTRIFHGMSIHEADGYAHHFGGREELQFNIGVDLEDAALLRHGVAFSFEPSRSLTAGAIVGALAPLVGLFNEYLELYPGLYADMQMWHETDGREWSEKSKPAAVKVELLRPGNFIFLGRRQRIDTLSYELILTDFDRLLPLYKYVESGGKLSVSLPGEGAFAFRPGCSKKAIAATATLAERELDLNLRHHLLQQALHDRLAIEHGEENVGTECPSALGTRIDLVVRRPDAFWFYEIKTARTPVRCIREALGQLLEYSLWPGAQEASRLVVAGEPTLDEDAEEYLRRLKNRFSLPIEYEQVLMQ